MNKNRLIQFLIRITVAASAILLFGCHTMNQKEKLTTQTMQTIDKTKEDIQQKKNSEIQKLKWDIHPDQDGTLVGYRIYLKDKRAKKGKLLIDLKDPKATELPLIYLGQINEEKANYLYLTVYDQKNIESKPSDVICVGKKCPHKKVDSQQK